MPPSLLPLMMRPGLAQAMPHAGEDNVRMPGLQFNISGTKVIGQEENLLPGLAAIARTLDAAFLVRHERIATGCDERLRLRWMD